MTQRLARLRAAMHAHDITALLVTHPTNRHYLSGFSGSAGVLLVTPDDAILITDFRYRTRAAVEAPHFTQRQLQPGQRMHQLLLEMAAEYALDTIWYEAAHVTVAQRQAWQHAIDANDNPRHTVELVATENLIEPLRAVKDAAELRLLQQAIAMTDATLEAVLPLLAPDHTEQQAAWLFERTMRDMGAQGVAFPIIVAAGANGASPHAEPGNRPLGQGQPIIIDMGAHLNGYTADLTRTIVLGEPDARFREVYHLVREAQERAIRGIRPNMSGVDADAIARDYLTAAGYGDAFGHSLGHGVGMYIHEAPRLARTSDDTLHVGNVFSIEPGIYLEDWGGVRIEDLVLLTENGCEVLSHAPKLPL